MKLLLLTDAPMDEASLGINRTLYNLLQDLPDTELHILSTAQTSSSSRGRFSHSPYYFIDSHIVSSTAAFMRGLNRMLLQLTPLTHHVRTLRAQNFTGALVCAQSVESFILFSRMLKSLKLPYLIYWMDDLKDYDRENWLFNNGKDLFQSLTQNAQGVLAVSERLSRRIFHRYGVSKKPECIVHNPVERLKEYKNPTDRNLLRIVYAGSLWPMHLDAFLLFARRLGELAREGLPLELLVYTPEHFWKSVSPHLPSSGVRYGGSLPYEECQHALLDADWALVTASFSGMYAHLGNSSLQTKVTEYLAAGLPLISIGPADAISHEFVQQWACGICMSSPEPKDIDATLRKLLKEHSQEGKSNRFSRQAIFDIVDKHFSRHVIQQQFLQFCSSCFQNR